MDFDIKERVNHRLVLGAFRDCAVIREVDEANDIASLTTNARGLGPVKYVYFTSFHSDKIDTTMIIRSWEVH